MTQARKACSQVGISPKVLYPAIVGLLTTLVQKLAIPWDPIIEHAISIVAMVVTGYFSSPGTVEVADGPDDAQVNPEAGDVKAPAGRKKGGA